MKPSNPHSVVRYIAIVTTSTALVACAHRPPPDATAAPEAPAPMVPEASADDAPVDPGLLAPTRGHTFLQDFEGDFETLFNELSGEEVGHAVTREQAASVLGVPCDAAVHAYDTTWGCTLTEAFALDQYTQAPGTWLGVYYDTSQRRALVLESLVSPLASVSVDGTSCAGFVHFHADGSLERCELAEARTFGNTRFPAGSSVALRPDGTVSEAFVYEPVAIGETEVQPGYVALDRDGAVTSTSPEFFGD